MILVTMWKREILNTLVKSACKELRRTPMIAKEYLETSDEIPMEVSKV